MEFLFEYGLFLAKTLTLVGGVAVVVFIIALLKEKSPKGTLKAEFINDTFENHKDLLNELTLSDAELKELDKQYKQKAKEEKKSPPKLPTCYVLNFKGDIKASPLDNLRQCVSAIVQVAKGDDEIFIHLESAGGYVPHYGAAAAQLIRLRDKGLRVVVSVDKVAGSGGYMMACVAHHIIASDFAVIGSIGVIGEVPNFHRLLDKNYVDYEQHTSGEYKRTLTTFGKNTEQAREKFKAQLADIHALFKHHIARFRPALDLSITATGETWFGPDALKVGLIDQILTGDDYLLNLCDTHNLIELSYEQPKSLKERLTSSSEGVIQGLMNQLLTKPLPRFF